MKALIRNDGEAVLERDGIEGIDWNTGAPLTNEAWCGGRYTLVDNYIEQADTVTYEEIVIEQVEEEQQAEEAEPEATVVIDGKTYTVSELKQLLGE